MKNITLKIIGFIRKYITFLLIIGLIIFLFSLGLYFWNMGHSFSKNSNDWSNFGSYFGGISGTILSAINLLILLVLAYQTKEQQNHEWITLIRINKYHELLKDLKATSTPQEYFKNKNLDDDFFLFKKDLKVLENIQSILRTKYTIKAQTQLLRFLKAVIKSDKNIVDEFISKYSD